VYSVPIEYDLHNSRRGSVQDQVTDLIGPEGNLSIRFAAAVIIDPQCKGKGRAGEPNKSDVRQFILSTFYYLNAFQQYIVANFQHDQIKALIAQFYRRPKVGAHFLPDCTDGVPLGCVALAATLASPHPPACYRS